MKFRSILASSLIAAASLFAVVAVAADQATDTGTPATTQKEPAKKKVKPHSHVQEKTGMQQPAPDQTAPDKSNAATDTSKHYHPRDMK